MATAMTTSSNQKQNAPVIDGRRTNGGTWGNSGGKPGRSGRKPWSPAHNSYPRDCGHSQPEEIRWNDARLIVQKMAAVGVPVEVIGRFLTPPIKDAATLKKYFARDLEIGRMRADLAVMATAFGMATSGNHERMTWWWMTRRVPGFDQTS